MNKFTKRILSLALVAMMMVTLVGSFSVSAAETEDGTRTIYFLNNKGWEDVYAYTYSEEGVAEVSFPGEELELIGHIKVWNNDIRDYELKEVYLVEDLGDEDDFIIFSEGYDHGQQSNDISIKYKWGGYNVIDLDVNNTGLIGHFFNPNEIIPIAE